MTFNATFISWEHIKTAGLVKYEPPLPVVGQRRKVFVTHEISQLLCKENADPVMFNRVEANRLLSDFVRGHMVSASLKGKTSEVERLTDMDDVWACCIRKPKPGWRLFGRFIGQDCLVLLKAYDRHELAQKSNYHAMAEAVITDWERLFPDVTPYSATSLAGYISGVVKNVDEE